jgi:hypothetical protein
MERLLLVGVALPDASEFGKLDQSFQHVSKYRLEASQLRLNIRSEI